jgi:hypothetical protein
MAQTTRIDQLRQACNLLLDQVENRFGPELVMEGDAVPADYWKVELKTAYTLAPSPTLVAGEFREDATEVLEVLSREPDSIFLWHDLDHLAGLLRGIAFMDLTGR